MAKRDLKERLLGYLESLPVVDCHSHTQGPDSYSEHPVSLFTMWGYFKRDADGIMQPEVPNAQQYFAGLPDDEARWRALKPLLHKAGNTTYWRHFIVTFRELFGLRDWEITDRNWRALNQRIKRVAGTKKWYDEVTRKRCGLVTQMRNVNMFREELDRKYFTPMTAVMWTFTLADHRTPTPEERRKERSKKPGGILNLETQAGTEINDLGDLKRVIRKVIEKHRGRGAAGIKAQHAYWRTLSHSKVEDAWAKKLLTKVLRGKIATEEERKLFGDWAYREAIASAGDLGMVVQIHTGVQGNWGRIPNSDPLLLLNLLRDFRHVKFDLFHAGYPYARQMGMLGKHYPNVWLNMCWMYVISTAASRQLLSEWLDLAPAHRLLGFGSDVHFPELILGHLVMARECMAQVLAEKVRKDYWSEERAREVGRMMLLENPCALYGIGTKQCKSANARRAIVACPV